MKTPPGGNVVYIISNARPIPKEKEKKMNTTYWSTLRMEPRDESSTVEDLEMEEESVVSGVKGRREGGKRYIHYALSYPEKPHTQESK